MRGSAFTKENQKSKQQIFFSSTSELVDGGDDSPEMEDAK